MIVVKILFGWALMAILVGLFVGSLFYKGDEDG